MVSNLLAQLLMQQKVNMVDLKDTTDTMLISVNHFSFVA